MKNWLAIESLAEDVGISSRTAWRWLKAGKIRKGEDESGRRVFTLANDANMSRDAYHDRQDISMSVDGAGGKIRGRRDPRSPSGIGNGFDPASHARQQVAAEEARLTLRQIQEAHHSLDQKEQERTRRVREEQDAAVRKERERQEAALRAQREAAEARERVRQEAVLRERREAAEAATRKRRAELIQKVLDDVVERYWNWEHEIPPSAKTAALQAVRKELSALPLEELPWAEVAAIAEGVRDGIYHPLFAAQDAERRRGEECREEEHRRAEIRQARIEAGTRHAENLLRDAEGLDFRDRLPASGKVKEALRREINGTESPADAERLAAELAAPFLADGKRKAEAERKEERRRAEEEHRAEADRTRREEEAEREERKRRLLRYADEYTGRALDDEEVPRGVDRWLCSETVKEKLGKRLSGGETEAEVEDLVENILDEELGE